LLVDAILVKNIGEIVMAWWDHEELKRLEDRSYRYVLSFPEDYEPEFVRNTAFIVLRYPQNYTHLQAQAIKLLSYGLPKNTKPKFKVKCTSIKSKLH
jgi:hypothetical protein